jgi:amino acid transporter
MFWVMVSTTPTDFFNNPVWQFFSGVGGIGAIISIPVIIIIAITAYRQQLRHREISYQLISNAPIVSINKAVESQVEITLDGNPVKNARLLVIKIWNSGNVGIKTEDYLEPISFEFETGKAISGYILETEPKALIDPKLEKTFLTVEPNSIELSKFPLNPKDSITFTTLLTEYGTITQKGRIYEGKLKEFEPDPYPFNKKDAGIVAVLFAILLILIFVIFNFINPREYALILLLSILIIIVCLVMLYFAVKNLIYHTKGLFYDFKKYSISRKLKKSKKRAHS